VCGLRLVASHPATSAPSRRPSLFWPGIAMSAAAVLPRPDYLAALQERARDIVASAVGG